MTMSFFLQHERLTRNHSHHKAAADPLGLSLRTPHSWSAPDPNSPAPPVHVSLAFEL